MGAFGAGEGKVREWMRACACVARPTVAPLFSAFLLGVGRMSRQKISRSRSAAGEEERARGREVSPRGSRGE